MKQKAFTLVELISVIVILGIILLIAVPISNKVLTDSKEKLYNVQINEIKNGLKNWAIDNNQILPTTDKCTIELTLGQLQLQGYIDTKIKNPKTDKCFNNDMNLKVTRYQKNYIYEVEKNSSVETNVCQNVYITLNGKEVVYVEVNSEYIDPSASAKDDNNNDISDSIIVQISGSGSSIDTSVIGNKYVITYAIANNNITTSIKRNVIIVESTTE